MPVITHPRYVIDEKGNKKEVILDYREYIRIMDALEDKEDSKLIQKTKNEPEISLEDYKRKRNIV